jgi:DNA gyrase subunit A
MGNILRTNIAKMKSQGRSAGGIIGMRLTDDDEIIGMQVIESGKDLLVLSEKGYGKRVKYSLFANKGRGGKGMTYLKISDKNGPALAIRSVAEDDDVILVTQKGQSIRVAAQNISQLGRITVGVRIVHMDEDDRVSDVAVIPKTE